MRLSIRGVATASGLLWGGMILLVGLCNAAAPGYGDAFLRLVASIYPGYQGTPGFGSILTGTAYGLLDGAIGGAIFAWLYNRFAGTATAKG
jgi:hypothetical protein